MNRVSEYALTRASSAVSSVPEAERPGAEQLIGICRSVADGKQLSQEELQMLARLVEVLARRSARAMPFAALGRAALASIRGDSREAARAEQECLDKLDLFGL
jgi:hypothetical protein